MTPRPIFPGCYWFVSRRCTQRQLLLRPDRVTNDVFMYCLAEAAQRFGIGVIGVVVMSNHYHAIYFDPHGRLPAFLAHLHKMVAKVMNCHRGRWENFWASEQTSTIECIAPGDQLDKLVYTLANPVSAQLVDKVVNWPGANSFSAQLQDREVTVQRPRLFFAKQGKMPERASLRFIRPAGSEALDHAEWADKLRTAVRAVEQQAAAERAKSGRRVLGRKAVLRQSFHATPNTVAPRRNARPTVACRSKWHRQEALRRNKDFLRRYADAFRRLRDGVRDVLFPAGTYLLRVRGLVLCEPLPAPA